MLPAPGDAAVSDGLLRVAVAAVSATLFGFLLWLLYARPGASGAEAPALLPAANAACNAASFACLLAGWRAIRQGRRERHRAFMLGAVFWSALFLAGYVAHKALSGDTPFAGQGLVRPVYFAVLASHVVATAVALPMILMTLARALGGRFPEHRLVARRTLPLWLYVSATGVAIFAFLKLWS